MKALLVDGLNLVRRIYAAVPDESQQTDNAMHSSGEHLAGVIASSAASLRRALNQHRPSHCVVVFDGDGRNWRHQLYPDYKKNRPPMPEPLRNELGQFEQAFNGVGVECILLAGYEADDIIATVAVKIAQRCEQHDDEQHGNGGALILSTDRNYCQLLSENITVFDHFGQRYLDAGMVTKRFQVEPRQLPDLLALAGDSSLSIPGVKSIGIRTAAKLLIDYDTLEKVLEAAKDMPGKLGGKLRSGREDARLAKTLFTLKTDVDLGINLNQWRFHPPE